MLRLNLHLFCVSVFTKLPISSEKSDKHSYKIYKMFFRPSVCHKTKICNSLVHILFIVKKICFWPGGVTAMTWCNLANAIVTPGRKSSLADKSSFFAAVCPSYYKAELISFKLVFFNRIERGINSWLSIFVLFFSFFLWDSIVIEC